MVNYFFVAGEEIEIRIALSFPFGYPFHSLVVLARVQRFRKNWAAPLKSASCACVGGLICALRDDGEICSRCWRLFSWFKSLITSLFLSMMKICIQRFWVMGRMREKSLISCSRLLACQIWLSIFTSSHVDGFMSGSPGDKSNIRRRNPSAKHFSKSTTTTRGIMMVLKHRSIDPSIDCYMARSIVEQATVKITSKMRGSKWSGSRSSGINHEQLTSPIASLVVIFDMVGLLVQQLLRATCSVLSYLKIDLLDPNPPSSKRLQDQMDA